MLVWWLLGGFVVVLGLVTVHYYNRFVTLENRCNEAWSNVDTELKRRHDLIPNLVAAVKGYAKHERSLFTAITKARATAMQDRQAGHHEGRAEAHLVGLLDKLVAVAEDYPALQASGNFLELQKELAITEDRIQAARRFYNGNVRDHRNATRQFPGTVFAAWFKPAQQEFFEAEAVHVPQVGL